MLFSFLNSYCKQIPIVGKADCKKNMEENGNAFSEGLLCAGGNGKGSCKVKKQPVFFKLSFQLHGCNDLRENASRVIAEES